MKNCFTSMLMTLVCGLGFLSPAHAQLTTGPTVVQLESDIRIALKEIYRLEADHYVEWGQFSTSLVALKYSLPSYLAPYVRISIAASGGTLNISMIGTAYPMSYRNYSINQTGSLRGMTQYDTARELEDEINLLIKGTDIALKAYFAEWRQYSSDLGQLGVVVPPYILKYGNLVVILDVGGYKIEFKGVSYPISGKIYKY